MRLDEERKLCFMRMEVLSSDLHFLAKGRDCDGMGWKAAFTLSGSGVEDSDAVTLVKVYDDGSQVQYRGTRQHDGGVFGQWIGPGGVEGGDVGEFRISPVDAAREARREANGREIAAATAEFDKRWAATGGDGFLFLS